MAGCFAFSQYALKYFLLFFRTSLNTFRAFRDDFVSQTTLILSFSSCTLKYLTSILQVPLNTLREFSEFAERMENTQKDIFTLKIPDEVNGTVFRENRMAYDEHITNQIFWLFLT
jgi:hypothetical protein